MKCNVRELAQLSDRPCEIEGRLNYKKISNGSYRNQAVFKERWFRLINNYLFYFKLSEMGTFDSKNPAGVFVMENSSIQMEHGPNVTFSFSISFIDEPEKKHVFAARTEDNVVQWVIKLRECSYEFLRSRLHTLQSKIFSITGKDPLLLVPRNDGACLWAPAIPFSTVPACTVSTSSFSCHLHTNGAFTLERSKSDVQAYRHLHSHHKKTTFYTDDIKQIEKKESPKNFGLERSNTSAQFTGSGNLDISIFDNRPKYSRAAPSPPVRTKLSPSSRRIELRPDVKILADQSKHLATSSTLDEAPIPPRRKISPKNIEVINTVTTTVTTTSSNGQAEGEDLIKF
ncbi:uncharacterized protein LOC113230432 [Hyposmocoma kahamanoa]|uniref:uncharacterized protein LOC113230432 n=1 Tax=Hyposmocoma kahamanoa TaxID=1477025 RepID=UPI000E6D9867|nr:uncharacterized protein LOC113230432 [Hyposmocoma kahamanoa]